MESKFLIKFLRNASDGKSKFAQLSADQVCQIFDDLDWPQYEWITEEQRRDDRVKAQLDQLDNEEFRQRKRAQNTVACAQQ